jgi:hypothetical protein
MFRIGDRVRIRNTYPIPHARGWVTTVIGPSLADIYYLDSKVADTPSGWENREGIAVVGGFLELADNGLDEVFKWLVTQE